MGRTLPTVGGATAEQVPTGRGHVIHPFMREVLLKHESTGLVWGRPR